MGPPRILRSPGAPLMLLLPNGDGRRPSLRGWRVRAAAEAPVGPRLGRGVRFGAISHRVSKGWSKLVGALACARAGARVHVLLHLVDLGFFSGHWRLPQRRTAVNRRLLTGTLQPVVVAPFCFSSCSLAARSASASSAAAACAAACAATAAASSRLWCSSRRHSGGCGVLVLWMS